MVEAFIGHALGFECIHIIGKAAFVIGGAVHQRHHTIHRHPRLDFRPVEGTDEGLGQGKPGGFDDDVIGRVGAGQKFAHGGDEIIRDGAADAAIGQFDDVIFAAHFIAAAFEDFAIHAHIPKFIDDEGDARAFHGFEQIADEGGFACAEKSGDDGCRDLRHGG